MTISSAFAVFAIVVWFTADAAQTGEESTKWICTSTNVCVIDQAANIGDAKRFESQHDCRLSCGKYGAIWPMPTSDCRISHERIHFDPSKVRFNSTAPDAASMQYLRESSRIFLSNILKECIRNCTLPKSKNVLVKTKVRSSSLVLDWSTNETYILSIRTTDTATFVEVKAQTVYGARHALETLSNLITGSKGNGLLMVTAARVRDGPIYPHRGLLLDTARNYIPIQLISRTLDAMAASKMNVLHWHAVDTQSFPLEITRVPELQQFGSYRSDMVYSRNDTHNIVRYARFRGIRLIIEIDGPSHAGNGWQWGPMSGFGNMSVCVNQQSWRSYCVEPPCGQLNPFNEKMYAIMKEIYEDLAEVNAPEETIHMGGDEVFIPCWNRTEEITRRMLDTGFDLSLNSFYKVWSDFHQKNLDSWDNVTQHQYPYISVPKSVILWSSHLTDPAIIQDHLPKERYIIQTWVDSDQTLNADLLAKGYRIIVSTKNAWYLDHGFWGNTRYYNWKQVYDNRLELHPLILGGEVCMWSEYVDQTSVESRMWPRAGAMAERLWANPNLSSLLVQTRFLRYRDRLIARGIKPDAVMPKWCILNEGQCS